MSVEKTGKIAALPGPGRDVPEVVVRDMRTLAEYRACVELEREVWGNGFEEVVPASLLKVGQEVGGITAGAFAGGELVGFVHGLTGIRRGRLTHWSHMLAVRAAHRGRGIGLRLKLYQRHRLLDRGVYEMRWTFDPLVAANAHFNLNVLGVRVERYVPDMYGDTGSGVHATGTDRLVSRWNLVEAPGPRLSGSGASAWNGAPILNGGGASGAAAWKAMADGARSVRIEIPRDVFGLEGGGLDSAREWRRSTRDAFVRATGAGFRVVGFSRDADASVCHYLLCGPEGNGGESG
jgi:chorismate synthase